MASHASALTGARIRIGACIGLTAAQAMTEFGLSPRTFAIIRWTQVVGQLVTVLVVAFAFDIDVPLVTLLALVAIGAGTTLWATRRLKPPRRLDEAQLGSILLLDAALIGTMLALTGALGNPFAVFLLFPAILAATTLGIRWCAAVCAVVLLVACLLAFMQGPVPWTDAPLGLPPLLTLGTWTALSLGTLLMATYAWRIAEEGRRMGRALAATQLALEREQRLSHLDGLATAAAHDLGSPLSTIAVLAKHIARHAAHDRELVEDAELLHQQACRCRDILARFADEAPSRAAAGTGSVPLSFILERLCAEHQARPVAIGLRTSVAADAIEPGFPPAGEVRHGLANLLDNAVTYARSSVVVSLIVERDVTVVRVDDDGPGFPPEILNQVGQPFVSSRGSGTTHGLGLFIACTFLTRAEAELEFANETEGASVTVTWPASRFEGKS